MPERTGRGEQHSSKESRTSAAASVVSGSSRERLQKILSGAGVTSRRKAEQMMLDGRVTVNGQQVRELGAKADLSKDHIKVDGKLVRPASQLLYLMMNKPRGYVTTIFDPQGRPTVIDLLRRVPER